MAGSTGFEPSSELGGRQAAADLALQRLPPGGSVDDALNVDGGDGAAHGGEADGQQVHDEARVDAGSDDTRAELAANFVQARGQGRFAQRWKEQFLARGDDADAGPGHGLDLRAGQFEFRDSGMKNKV